jgi:hypothetical protein
MLPAVYHPISHLSSDFDRHSTIECDSLTTGLCPLEIIMTSCHISNYAELLVALSAPSLDRGHGHLGDSSSLL